jgi:tryptophanase
LVLPLGGLGCHVDAARFLDFLPPQRFAAATVAAAIYLVGGIRVMERGILSRGSLGEANGTMGNELVRFAFPRRVFSSAQIAFAADRLTWLYANRSLLGGFRRDSRDKEPTFASMLQPEGAWVEALNERFLRDMPSGL